MAKFKLELKGNKALAKSLSKMSSETKQMVNYEIESSLRDIEAEAQTKAPVDAGFLRNHINMAHSINRNGGVVVANAHYAPYVEFGTGGMVNVPAGLESYARQFKGKGVKEVNLPPRPFLFPAFYKEVPKLIERINKGLKNWK